MDTLETKVAVLEHDLKQVQVVFGRLDVAIEKIGDVSNCINKMLAVHDTKLEAQENVNEDIYQSLEVHRNETKASNAELHSRITTTTRELESKIQATEDRLLEAIKDLKKSVEKEEEKNKERIDKLEKAKYLFVGGGIVVGAIVTKILPMLAKFIQIG
jgi:chromosome condensin MukBEF complex kleisin-like MukF subunit